MCGLLVLTFVASMILMAAYGHFDSDTDNTTRIVTPFFGYYIFVAAVCGIYLFFSSMGSFKENFLMMQQNSVSRKSMFVARLETIGIMSLVMTVCTLVFYYLTWAVLRIMYMIEGSSDTMALSFAEPNSNAILTLVETVCGFLLLMAIGYFITVLFYRLNKTGKILVPILVCVLLVMFPTVYSLFGGHPIIPDNDGGVHEVQGPLLIYTWRADYITVLFRGSIHARVMAADPQSACETYSIKYMQDTHIYSNAPGLQRSGAFLSRLNNYPFHCHTQIILLRLRQELYLLSRGSRDPPVNHMASSPYLSE